MTNKNTRGLLVLATVALLVAAPPPRGPSIRR
jgi:hypothetical protein